MEGNWIVAAIVLAALAGGVAWVVFTIVPETWRAARTPVVIVAALLGALNGWHKFGGAYPTAPVLERELLESPDMGELARAWKDADPAGFDAFVHEALDARREGNVGEMIEILRPRLTAALTQRLPRLSDTEIVTIERSTHDALLVFATLNPRFCYAMVSGHPVNLTAEEVKDTQEAMRTLSSHRMSIFVAAFRADATTPIDAMAGEELARALGDVHMRTAAVVGEADMALIQSGGPPSAEHERRYCEVMAEFERQLAESADPGRLYRGILLSQAQQ
jgi:hypothetical protein